MHELISQRWSARGYDAQATVATPDLTAILDAGRWAATWGRVQPVRFIVGVRGTEGTSTDTGDDTFTRLAATLTRGNAGWAPRASALILLCTTHSPEDAKAHEYGAVDVGIALAQMSIQAQALGLNAHPMAGFDIPAAATEFGIPDNYRPLVMLAIGTVAADPQSVPADIRERDNAPRERLPLSAVAFAGAWGTPFTP